MSLTTDMDTTPTVTTTARGLLMLRLDASTQGYVPYYGYGHYAYGHYYGKRAADAETGRLHPGICPLLRIWTLRLRSLLRQ